MCAAKEYLRGISIIWSSPLSDCSRVQATNQCALPELRYLMWTQHPIYDLYYGSRCGKDIHIGRKVINTGGKHRSGYLIYRVRAEGSKQKNYLVHRFVFECYNGLIPEGMKIDHKNDIRDDNRLCNCQLVTP